MKFNTVKLISILKENARLSIRKISDLMNTPISTVHENLHKLVNNKTIKPITMYKYERIGLPIHIWLILQTKNDIPELIYANNILRSYDKSTIIVEAYFDSMYSLNQEINKLKKIGKVRTYPVIEEIQREGWQGYKQHTFIN